MKLVSNYKTITIETGITAKVLKTIKAHAPKALALFDENKRVIFSIGISAGGSIGSAGIGSAGIDFSNTTKTGTMYVTVCDQKMPEEDDKRRAYIEEHFGATLVKLAQIEQQVSEALTTLDTSIAAVAESIIIQ